MAEDYPCTMDVLPCLKCGKPLELLRATPGNYAWHCRDGCFRPVDTGVTTTEAISSFETRVFLDGVLQAPVFVNPLQPIHLAGAKVYMPYALWHFIKCTWGGCYNSIYQNFLVPHLDSVPVLDYILRSPVVGGALVLENGIPAPKMFPELLWRLRGVKSPKIQEFLTLTFENNPRREG